MNLKELIITSVLAAFDRCMDWLTRGTWTRVRGSETVNIIKIKE